MGYIQKLTAPSFAFWFLFWHSSVESVRGRILSRRQTRKSHIVCSECLEDSLYGHQISLYLPDISYANFHIWSWRFSCQRKAVTLDLAISACKAFAWNCSWVGPCMGGGRQGVGQKLVGMFARWGEWKELRENGRHMDAFRRRRSLKNFSRQSKKNLWHAPRTFI